jgi:hypothetical protein
MGQPASRRDSKVTGDASRWFNFDCTMAIAVTNAPGRRTRKSRDLAILNPMIRGLDFIHSLSGSFARREPL